MSNSLLPVPIPGRNRSQTIVPGVSSEIYNLPSRQRQDLLQQLADALNTEKIPVPFGPALKFDIQVLGELVEQVRSERLPITITMSEFCQYIPLLWPQKPHKNGSTTSNTTSNDDGSPTKRRYRDSKAASLAFKRDNELCVIKKKAPVQIAHIYPSFLLGPKSNKQGQEAPKFWSLLSFLAATQDRQVES